jgi:hypothetical protein
VQYEDGAAGEPNLYGVGINIGLPGHVDVSLDLGDRCDQAKRFDDAWTTDVPPWSM